jgi:hypothetical protein
MTTTYLADISPYGDLYACGFWPNFQIAAVFVSAIAICTGVMWGFWWLIEDVLYSSSSLRVLPLLVLMVAIIVAVCVGSFYVAVWLTEGSCSV